MLPVIIYFNSCYVMNLPEQFNKDKTTQIVKGLENKALYKNRIDSKKVKGFQRYFVLCLDFLIGEMFNDLHVRK